MLRDQALFTRCLLRHPASVGAVAPSSAALARAMTEGLVVGPGESVIEFGPGTGAFTGPIASLLPGPGSYLGIEREASFVGLLNERFPGLRVAHGSAEDADRHHAEAGLGPVRCVVSGLPFASLPTAAQDAIIGALGRLLGPGAQFRTFQYLHAYPLPRARRFRERMRAVFGPATVGGLVARNLPPACVLIWRR